MAEADLIAAYLNELQPSLRWQRTADLVALELEDHLRESAARRTALGVDSDTAQRETLHQFGDPSLSLYDRMNRSINDSASLEIRFEILYSRFIGSSPP